MNKLCLIFNIAPHYRNNIYQLIDKYYDCRWFFGENKTNVKGLDLSCLKNVTIGKNIKIFKKKAIYWQADVFPFQKNQNAKTYLILGEPICLSTWFLLIKLKTFHSAKYIYMWTHGWYGRENRCKVFLKKVFFSMADGIFLYGNYAKELMIQQGFDANKLYVIYNSLDYDKQLKIRNSLRCSNIYTEHFGNSNHTLIFIGRLTKKKKLDLIIEALYMLNKQLHRFNLIFVGDGEMMEQLKALVFDKGLEQCVWFYGECYDEAVNARLLYSADLCVSPGFVGLTAMHSLMFGTPVVTHNDFKNQAPEFEAVKEGETGAFFEMNSLKSLVETISKWFNNECYNRNDIREKCYAEIDQKWTPKFQIKLLNEKLKF